MQIKSLFIVIVLMGLYFTLYTHVNAEVIADLSTDFILKDRDFKGVAVSLSGISDTDNSGILISVVGPNASYRIWKKVKRYGMWVNSKGLLAKNIPAFYMVASTDDITQCINPGMLTNMKLNGEFADIFDEECTLRITSGKQNLESFLIWLYDYKIANGLYTKKTSIERIGNNLFRAKIPLPESAPVGRYTVALYKFQNDKMIEKKYMYFDVIHSKFAATIVDLSTKRPLHYAGVLVLISITTGALAGYVFRSTPIQTKKI